MPPCSHSAARARIALVTALLATAAAANWAQLAGARQQNAAVPARTPWSRRWGFAVATYQAPQRAPNFTDAWYAAGGDASSSWAGASSTSLLDEAGVSKAWLLGGDDYVDPNTADVDADADAADAAAASAAASAEEAAHMAAQAAPAARLRASRKVAVDADVNARGAQPQSPPRTGGGGLRNDVWLWRTTGPAAHWRQAVSGRAQHRGAHGEVASVVVSGMAWARVGPREDAATPPARLRAPGGGGYRAWLCCVDGGAWFPCLSVTDACAAYANATSAEGRALRAALRWSPRRGHAAVSLYGVSLPPELDGASAANGGASQAGGAGGGSASLRRLGARLAAAARRAAGLIPASSATSTTSSSSLGFAMVVMGGRARSFEAIGQDAAVGVVPLPTPPAAAAGANTTTAAAAMPSAYREDTILTSDVWASTDGASWRLMNGGCFVPQREHSPPPGTAAQACATDGDCYVRRLGNAACVAGACVCRHWSPRERFAAAVVAAPPLASTSAANASPSTPWIVVSGGLTAVSRGMCGRRLCPASVPLLLNDVWASGDVGRTWTQLTPSAPWPPRCDHALAFLRRSGTLWLLGGRSTRALLQWRDGDGGVAAATPLSADDAATAAQRATLPYADNDLDFSGGGGGSVAPPALLNDAWVSAVDVTAATSAAAPAGAVWTLNASTSPWPPRAAFAAVADGARLWLLGGESAVPPPQAEDAPDAAEQARIAAGRAGLPGQATALAGTSLYGPQPLFELSSWRSGGGRAALLRVGSDGDGSGAGGDVRASSGGTDGAGDDDGSGGGADADSSAKAPWYLADDVAGTAPGSATAAAAAARALRGGGAYATVSAASLSYSASLGLPSFLPVGDVWSLEDGPPMLLPSPGHSTSNATTVSGIGGVTQRPVWRRDYDPPSPARLYFHPQDALALPRTNLSTRTLAVLAAFGATTWADLADLPPAAVAAMRAEDAPDALALPEVCLLRERARRLRWRCTVQYDAYDGEELLHMAFQDGPGDTTTAGGDPDADDGCGDLRAAGLLAPPYLPDDDTDAVCRQSFPPRRAFAAFALDGQLLVAGGYEGANAFGGDVWVRDDTPPGTYLTGAPADGTSDSVFTFACTEGACAFQCRLWDTGSGAMLRNWSACASPFNALGVNADKRATRFEVRATDAAGNRDDGLRWYPGGQPLTPGGGGGGGGNVYVWTYVPPPPWLLIGLLVGGLLLLLILLLCLWRRHLRRLALQRYLRKRADRRLRRARREEEEQRRAAVVGAGAVPASVAGGKSPPTGAASSAAATAPQRLSAMERFFSALDRWTGSGDNKKPTRDRSAGAFAARKGRKVAAAARKVAPEPSAPPADATVAVPGKPSAPPVQGSGPFGRFVWRGLGGALTGGSGGGKRKIRPEPSDGDGGTFGVATTTTRPVALGHGGSRRVKIAPAPEGDAAADGSGGAGKSTAILNPLSPVAASAGGGGTRHRSVGWAGSGGGAPAVADTRGRTRAADDGRRGHAYVSGASTAASRSQAYRVVPALPALADAGAPVALVNAATTAPTAASLRAQSGAGVYVTNPTTGIRIPVAPVLPARPLPQMRPALPAPAAARAAAVPAVAPTGVAPSSALVTAAAARRPSPSPGPLIAAASGRGGSSAVTSPLRPLAAGSGEGRVAYGPLSPARAGVASLPPVPSGGGGARHSAIVSPSPQQLPQQHHYYRSKLQAAGAGALASGSSSGASATGAGVHGGGNAGAARAGIASAPVRPAMPIGGRLPSASPTRTLQAAPAWVGHTGGGAAAAAAAGLPPANLYAAAAATRRRGGTTSGIGGSKSGGT